MARYAVRNLLGAGLLLAQALVTRRQHSWLLRLDLATGAGIPAVDHSPVGGGSGISLGTMAQKGSRLFVQVRVADGVGAAGYAADLWPRPARDTESQTAGSAETLSELASRSPTLARRGGAHGIFGLGVGSAPHRDQISGSRRARRRAF